MTSKRKLAAVLATGCLITACKVRTSYHEGEVCLASDPTNGSTRAVVTFDSCVSSSESVDDVSCSVSINEEATEILVVGSAQTSIGRIRGQNDDCNVLAATCDVPDLPPGSYVLEHAGQRQAVELPATAPCPRPSF